MKALKRPLDPWQQWILRRGLGQVPSEETPGAWEHSANQCGCWVSRQNGKGDILMALELTWLFLQRIPLSIHSAHLYPTAAEAFMRIEMLAGENMDILGQYIDAFQRSKGEQGIVLKKSIGGGRLRFMARAQGTGLGFSAPRLALDEAQALDGDLMQTILPVLSAQPDTQVWFFGTPPRANDAWIYQIKRAGEARMPGVAWFDYGIDYIDPMEPAFKKAIADPATWAATNPSLGLIRGNGTGLRRRAIESELITLGKTVRFAQDRCGMWLPEKREAGDELIDSATWEARAADPVKISELADNGGIAIGFHVNRRRTHYTVAYAGKYEGKWRVGIVAHGHGTDGLAAKLKATKLMYNPLVFTADAKGEPLVNEVAGGGLAIKVPEDPDEPKRGQLLLPSMHQVAMAVGLLVDAARNDQMRHEDAPPLNSAVSVPPRPLGGSGVTFDHTRGIEVGPGVAVALAMWAHREWADKVTEAYDPLDHIW